MDKVYIGDTLVERVYLGETILLDTFIGTSYYISNLGDINNDGLSPNNPWPLSKVQDNAFYPEGVRFRFNRGETYIGQVKTSGNSINPESITQILIYDAYGSGELPILTTRQTLDGWNIESNWSLTEYTNVWAMSLNEVHNTYPRLYVNIDGGFVEATRARLDSLVDVDHIAAFANIGPPQQLYIYAPINPALYYSGIEYPGMTQAALAISNQHKVTIRNLDIRGGSGSSLNLEFAEDVLVTNCKIGWNAGHTGIAFNRCKNVRITNNLVDSGDRLIDNFIYQHGVGDAVLIGKGNSDIEVDNNTIKNWGHSIIEITSEDPEQITEPITNIRVHHNDVSAPDVDYCRAMAINCNVGTNILIDYNNFHDLPVQTQLACNGGLIVENNTFDNITNCVNYDVSTGMGISIIGYSGFKPRNMIIRYNTFSNCDAAGIDVGDPYSTTGYQTIYNNTIHNNVFINNSKNVKNPWYDNTIHTAGAQMKIRTDPNLLNNIYTNNVFDGILSVFYKSNGLITVSEFNSLNSTNGDVISNNTQSIT